MRKGKIKNAPDQRTTGKGLILRKVVRQTKILLRKLYMLEKVYQGSLCPPRLELTGRQLKAVA